MEELRRIFWCKMIDQKLATQWHNHLVENKYAYNFEWLGRKIIQEPQDIVCLQELIWKVKPDLIIETGVAHGGSLVLSASILALLNIENPIPRKVIGIDIDIRLPNLNALNTHPLKSYIHLIESSSIEKRCVQDVKAIAKHYKNIMVILDSDHTHKHVLAELEAYAPLVTKGSYCVVFDTGVEDLPTELCFGRPWGKGNSPRTAVWEYMQENRLFVIDKEIEQRMATVSNPDGWLRHV